MHLYTDHVEMALSTKPTHDYRKTNTLHHVVRAVYGTNKKRMEVWKMWCKSEVVSCPLYPSGVIKVLTSAL